MVRLVFNSLVEKCVVRFFALMVVVVFSTLHAQAQNKDPFKIVISTGKDSLDASSQFIAHFEKEGYVFKKHYSSLQSEAEVFELRMGEVVIRYTLYAEVKTDGDVCVYYVANFAGPMVGAPVDLNQAMLNIIVPIVQSMKYAYDIIPVESGLSMQ